MCVHYLALVPRATGYWLWNCWRSDTSMGPQQLSHPHRVCFSVLESPPMVDVQNEFRFLHQMLRTVASKHLPPT